MKKTVLGVGVVVLVVVALLISSNGSRPSSYSGAQFMQTYHQTVGAILLDVRTPAEYDAGHLEGAININFESPSFASELQRLDKTKTYFVYCRSGNRSGQAITIMQKAGFGHIAELQGGIISNQDSLTLITASSSAYTVDAGDMVNGSALIAGIGKTTLTEKEIAGLIQMREEEKLARDVYTTLGARWGAVIFSTIASSEQTHTDAIKVLLDRYAIPDPAAGAAVGVFRSSVMQKLYSDLTTKGQGSLVDALRVGATVEDLDIRDLDSFMKETTKQDILITYSNLQRGSRNHLRAFVRNITASGGSYAPQYITPAAFEAIITASQERGRM